jgi:hypothetical protein
MSDVTVWVLFLMLCAVVLDAIPPKTKTQGLPGRAGRVNHRR